MYGYVVPFKQKLSMPDFVLYRAFYCGICKCTGSLFGQLPRFTTNYDMVFLALLVHDQTRQEVEIAESGCVCNPFKKKACVLPNELLEKLAAVNIILSYYKAEDGVADREGLKYRTVRSMLRVPYRKAKALLPAADDIVRTRYEQLRKLESENAAGLDQAAHPFASMLRDIAALLLGGAADENNLALCYNIGKFVYLTDAFDDIEEDAKKRRYNPFTAAYGVSGRAALLEAHSGEVNFLFNVTVNRAAECLNSLQFSQSRDLMINIVHSGLREKTAELLGSKKKLPAPKI